ncbi:MAG: hypothetical protein ACLR5X_17890 [Oscillospiraceae bacterium]
MPPQFSCVPLRSTSENCAVLPCFSDFGCFPTAHFLTFPFISMNTQNIVRLEVDDGNGIQVIDIDSGKPFAIVLPLNVGNICFYDTNGNVVEYLRQQL